MEVAEYVYRENILLTIIGALAGIVLGIILHRFVIVTVEIEEVMFGRNINFISFHLQFSSDHCIFSICELGNVL